MRARNIKPGFFKDEDVLKCDPLARILWEGLWCYADREGRFKWKPFEMKIEILPADNCEINLLLGQLLDAGLIEKYEIDGKSYGYIPKFLEHQVPHFKERASTIPAQCKPSTSLVQAQVLPSACPSDSLIPDSLIPDSKRVQERATPPASPDLLVRKLDSLCKKINSLPKKKESFNPHQWVQASVKRQYHPDAIELVLNALITNWENIGDPWAYATKVISKQSGNFYEKDAKQCADKDKVNFMDLINQMKAVEQSHASPQKKVGSPDT